MKNDRATVDKRVIEAWDAKVAAFERKYGRPRRVLVAALVVGVCWLLYAPSAFALVAMFALVCVLIALQGHSQLSLLCPNCNRPPGGYLARGSGADEEVCVHCYYWLREPPWSRPKQDA